MSRVIGIDPGLAALGWAVVERDGSRLRLAAHGCIATTPAQGSDLDRVELLARGLREVLDSHRIDLAVTEAWRYYGGRSEDSSKGKGAATTQAHTIGLVLGMVRTVCASAGVRHVEGERAQGWRAALGLPRAASKAACQERVRVVLGLAKVIRPNHASDAAAVATVAAMRGGRV